MRSAPRNVTLADVGLAGDAAAAAKCSRRLARTSREDVGHSGGAAGSIRLTPVSASKIVSLVVSNANSTVWPGVTLRLGGNPCHELVLADPGVGGQLGELRGLRARALGAEVHVLVGAQRFDDVDGHLERQRPDPRVGVDQRRVLEVLGPDADDHVGRAWDAAPSMSCTSGVSVTSPNGSRTPTSVSVRREEVHRRRSDEARDEQVRRAGRRAPRACRSAGPPPPACTTTRSPSVIASVWSWVT